MRQDKLISQVLYLTCRQEGSGSTLNQQSAYINLSLCFSQSVNVNATIASSHLS